MCIRDSISHLYNFTSYQYHAYHQDENKINPGEQYSHVSYQCGWVCHARPRHKFVLGCSDGEVVGCFWPQHSQHWHCNGLIEFLIPSVQANAKECDDSSIQDDCS